MRKTSLGIVIVGFTLAMAGCATMEPRAELAASGEVFTATVEALTAMRAAGEFSPEEIGRLDVLIHMGQKMLNAWTDAVLAGQPPGNAREKFKLILEGLQEYYQPPAIKEDHDVLE